MPTTTSKSSKKSRARRPAPRTTGPNIPILPVAIGVAFLLVLAVLLVFARLQSGTGPGRPVANISCDSAEQVAVHYHAHVEIIAHGTSAVIPAQTGILQVPAQAADPLSGSCFYWLHTHDTSGVVHIEAPQSSANRQFTLGDFFKIWGQPLSSTQVATIPVRGGDQLRMWVDGKPFTGDPNAIVLRSHTQVVLEIGPPFTDPPPTFTFDPQRYPQ
jgi:hypothetical protein